jgi:hypothetical protein
MQGFLSIALVCVFVAAALAGPKVRTTQPATQPTVFPAEDAPLLRERIGQLDAITIRFQRRVASEEFESWDVVLRDREALAQFEEMRRSDWQGMVMFREGFGTTVRFGAVKYVGYTGALKLASAPYGLSISAPDGRKSLFVQTGDAAKRIHDTVEAEALRQRPEHPIIERSKP